jgi:hypothetical protein
MAAIWATRMPLTDGCPCLISQALAAPSLAYAMAGCLLILDHHFEAWLCILIGSLIMSMQ